MKITSTTTYKITFQVAYYEHSEGGMDTDTFGPECDSVQQALPHWDLAQIDNPSKDWVITCNVTKETK